MGVEDEAEEPFFLGVWDGMLTKFGVARANQKKGFRMSVVKKNFERMNERNSCFDAIQHGTCEQRFDIGSEHQDILKKENPSRIGC